MSIMSFNQPGLFGLHNSNRDFTKLESWGKNNFNSAFPAALCCYMASKNMPANYLQFSQKKFGIKEISISQIFGIDPLANSTFFSFETAFDPFRQFAKGVLPRTDLVLLNNEENFKHTSAFEIKLTAVPDQTTYSLGEDSYGAELVIRPDTIFYLAAGLAHSNLTVVKDCFRETQIALENWSNPKEVLEKFPAIHDFMSNFLNNNDLVQRPNIIQPIWKTNGKSPSLADDALDLFVWSTTGFLHFILSISNTMSPEKITRQMRTLIWTYSMLRDIANDDKTDFESTIDRLSFNTKNDKAFAASGAVTRGFMKHANLVQPRIKKSEVREIILGNGQNLLSPERRFDAIVVNSPELFHNANC